MGRFRLDGIEVEAAPYYGSRPVATIHGPAAVAWGDWVVVCSGGRIVVAADEFARIAEPLDDEAHALLAGESYV